MDKNQISRREFKMHHLKKEDFTNEEIEFLKAIYEFLGKCIENEDPRLKKMNCLPLLGEGGPIGENYKNFPYITFDNLKDKGLVVENSCVRPSCIYWYENLFLDHSKYSNYLIPVLKEIFNNEKDLRYKSLAISGFYKKFQKSMKERELRLIIFMLLDFGFIELSFFKHNSYNQDESPLSDDEVLTFVRVSTEGRRYIKENHIKFQSNKIIQKGNNIHYAYPNSNEIIEYHYTTDFNWLENPSILDGFIDSSGMKFDNFNRNFYGRIPDSNINAVLKKTKFYVEKDKINLYEVRDYINKIKREFKPNLKYDPNERYDFSLSFAGEDREKVEEIALKLHKRNIKVFYDDFYRADLAGKDLSKLFRDVYGKNTQFVVVFISKYYRLKEWTDFELQIARDAKKAKNKEDFIIPIKFDDTIIHGILSTIAHLNYQKEGSDGIVKKLTTKLILSKK